MNPRGEVPALKHGSKIVVESSRILEYIDHNIGKRPGQLYPAVGSTKINHFIKLFDAVPTFPLTYGAVLFHTGHMTDILRWPYCSSNVRESYRELISSLSSNLRRQSIEVSDIPAGKVLAEKAEAFDKHIRPIFEDVKLYENILSQVEATLDEVESELSSDNRMGPWLCGATFTAADISLACLMLRVGI